MANFLTHSSTLGTHIIRINYKIIKKGTKLRVCCLFLKEELIIEHIVPEANFETWVKLLGLLSIQKFKNFKVAHRTHLTNSRTGLYKARSAHQS